MLTHAFSCLQGPITRSRWWWHAVDLAGPAVLDDPEILGIENSGETESPVDRPFRSELVERIRREIAAGTYDTSRKWELALDRLFDRLEE